MAREKRGQMSMMRRQVKLKPVWHRCFLASVSEYVVQFFYMYDCLTIADARIDAASGELTAVRLFHNDNLSTRVAMHNSQRRGFCYMSCVSVVFLPHHDLPSQIAL